MFNGVLPIGFSVGWWFLIEVFCCVLLVMCVYSDCCLGFPCKRPWFFVKTFHSGDRAKT